MNAPLTPFLLAHGDSAPDEFSDDDLAMLACGTWSAAGGDWESRKEVKALLHNLVDGKRLAPVRSEYFQYDSAPDTWKAVPAGTVGYGSYQIKVVHYFCREGAKGALAAIESALGRESEGLRAWTGQCVVVDASKPSPIAEPKPKPKESTNVRGGKYELCATAIRRFVIGARLDDNPIVGLNGNPIEGRQAVCWRALVGALDDLTFLPQDVRIGPGQTPDEWWRECGENIRTGISRTGVLKEFGLSPGTVRDTDRKVISEQVESLRHWYKLAWDDEPRYVDRPKLQAV